jgi:mono/diheme cytochrome c family protein
MNVPFVNDVGAIPARSQARLRARALKEDSMAISLAVRIGGLVLGAALLLALGLSGPSPRVADAQAPWVAPASEKAKKNPLPSDKKTIDQGEKVAKINCASCHGAKGKGDGAAAAALNPKPADWTSSRVQDESDGEIFWKITTGRGPMPSWRHVPENDRWAVVRYIRTLAAK